MVPRVMVPVWVARFMSIELQEIKSSPDIKRTLPLAKASFVLLENSI